MQKRVEGESAAPPKPRQKGGKSVNEQREIISRVAGHPEPILRIDTGRLMCGHISDGIGLANGEKSAGYVLAFSDLEKAYLAAKKFRQDHPPDTEEKRMASLVAGRERGDN